jgi:peptidoglycan/LPS O-acetylase OafA/YrhL
MPPSKKLSVFYGRRAIRIFPAYYVLVVAFILINGSRYPLAYLFYYINIKSFILSLDLHGAEAISLFGQVGKNQLHLWSLAVEEQFYLLYPLLFLVIKGSRRHALYGAMIIIGITTRLTFCHFLPHSYFGFLLPACLEYFAWGCIFSHLDLQKKRRLSVSMTGVSLVSLGLVVMLIFIEYHFNLNGLYQHIPTHFTTPIAFLLGLFLYSVWNLPVNSVVSKVLTIRPLVYLGLISYPMYLVHYSVIVLYRVFVFKSAASIGMPLFQTGLFFYLFCYAVTLVVASMIWHFIEIPMARLRKYMPVPDFGPPATADVVELSAVQSG